MHTQHLQKDERQLPIPGWVGYYVTSLGRIFSYKRQGFQTSVVDLDAPPKELRPIAARVGIGKRRVYGVSLNNGRKLKRFVQIPHSVLAAFVGPKPAGLVICHRDDDTANNRLDNLRYDTQAANAVDAIRNGRTRQGERAWKARFTNEQARAIRESPYTIRELAVTYGVARGIIEDIKKYRSYKYAGGVSQFTWSGRGRKPRARTPTGG